MASTSPQNGLGNNHGHTPGHPNDSVASSASEMIALLNLYEHFARQDGEKDAFVQELFYRINYQAQQLAELQSQRKSEREVLAECQRQNTQLQTYYFQTQRTMADNPTVVVLIDGDGMIFVNEFLRHGEAGGRTAASQLYAAVQEYIQVDTTDIPLGARIVCRIYANVRGLSDVLARKGIIDDVSVFEDFARGFTRGKTMFDFIDVGSGKDRADEKIIESFKMFSQDVHCRRLLFGCSHDNGYARALEEYSDKPEIVEKVVLLEGVPFEKELVPLPYGTKKFLGLFRDTKIVLNPSAVPYVYNQPATPVGPSSNSINGAKTYSMLPGLPTRFPAPVSRPTGIMDSPLPSRAALAASSPLPRTPSASTLASDSFPNLGKTVSWASKAAAPPPPVSDAPVYKPALREEQIARNRAGQRVDPQTKDYDKTEVDRVKKLKLCNVHFLRKECPYDTNCTHAHKYNATADEIRTLRLVARMAPCTNGSGCQDLKCIYGHRCPAPPHKYNHVKGTKSCIFGEACKFPPELHDIDMNVVKTMVIR